MLEIRWVGIFLKLLKIAGSASSFISTKQDSWRQGPYEQPGPGLLVCLSASGCLLSVPCCFCLSLPNCMSACLSVYLSLSFSLFLYLLVAVFSVGQPVNLYRSMCVSFSLFIGLYLFLSVRLFVGICLYISIWVYLFVGRSLSVNLSMRIFNYLGFLFLSIEIYRYLYISSH